MVKWTDEGKPKLSFMERTYMRKIIKDLKKVQEKAQKIIDVQEQKKKISEALMDVIDILDIIDPETNEKATQESLENLELDDLIQLFEDVVKELEKTI